MDDKSTVYSHIATIESQLVKCLPLNKHAEIIVREIVEDAMMSVHDASCENLSEEQIAKASLLTAIQSFYDARNISTILDKYANADNRKFYGLLHREKIPRDVLLNSMDILKGNIRKERDTLIKLVNNTPFPKQTKSSPIKVSWKILLSILIFLVVVTGIFSYALTHRYIRMNNFVVFDKWTGHSIDIHETEQND